MKHLLILLSFALCEQASTQFPDYCVFLVSGEVTITKPNAKAIAVKQKEFVYKNDIISVKKGASVTLLDKEGSFLILNSAGVYKRADLNNQLNKKSNDGITGKYLKLLYHELLDPEENYEKFKKENLAGVRAGVSRGEDCGNLIFPINGLKTSAASVIFKWHKTSPSSNYSFEIYDGENKAINKLNVKDTFLTQQISETLQSKPGIYKWRVVSEDGSCEDEMPIYLEILSPESEKKLVEQIVVETGEPNLENRLTQIDKLEKNRLIDAASSQYAALVNAYPDDKILRKSYVAFLLKYGFEEKAKIAWKP